MRCFGRVLACALVCVSFCSVVEADIVGDVIEASLTIDPDSSTFDESAISGTATVVDPGREFQSEVSTIPTGAAIDFFIDINNEELTFGFERTDSINADFQSGFGRTVTMTISDIDWTDNPIDVEFLSQSTFGNSSWEGDPSDFDIVTTSDSIQVEFASGYSLGADGGFITATYAISSVPEPGSFGLLGLCIFGFTVRRQK